VTESIAVATREQPQLTPFEIIERVITQGDLAKMTAQERVAFYWRTCESLGLNPLTRPFEFHNLNGKLVMYAKKDATDQLRKLNAVSVTNVRRERDDDLGLLTVYAAGRDRTGREDEATGVVSIKGLGGEALANAVMKAETKAKRRLTLSLVGLGFLDESELPDGIAPDVDPTTGELLERPKPKSLLESVRAQQEAMASTAAADPDVSGTTPDAVAGDVDEDQANDVDEAAWTTVPAELTELSADAFQGLREQHEIAVATVAQAARRLFPEAKRLGDLTDAQRAELWAAVAPEED
jgi:hypothetical protein